jgi:crotonobetainyl-CoA:carnitine CoA-transferase CaiB-like acyl-CoA transferase
MSVAHVRTHAAFSYHAGVSEIVYSHFMPSLEQELEPIRGALDGVLVADFSRVLAGPYMTMLLGDLGATIIKVESPEGDGTRTWGPPWLEDGESTYFSGINRNKSSVTLDLKDPSDRALAVTLVERSDVLVENFLPGKMKEFDLDYHSLRFRNPRLVYCSISGFGSTSAGAALPGYDMLAQAASGLMSITGPTGGPAFKTGVALVDVLCGLHAAVGILAALHSRSQDGQGQHIEVNLLATALSALTNQASSFLLAGVEPEPMGNAHPSVAPYDTFPTKDGDIVVAVGTDRQWEQLCLGLEMVETANDDRFRTNRDRVLNRELLTRRIGDALAHLTREEAIERLRDRGVPSGSLNSIGEAFEFARSIGMDPTWTTNGRQYVRTPMSLSGTPPSLRLQPPALDEQGDEIRTWLTSETTRDAPI